MNFIQNFNQMKPIKLLFIAAIIGVLAKIIERWFVNAALGLQLICFVILIFGLIKLSNKKIK